MGKLLLVVGSVLVLVGLVMMALERRTGGAWRLPGDIEGGGPGWRFSFPIATSIVVSLVLTVVLNLALWLLRRR